MKPKQSPTRSPRHLQVLAGALLPLLALQISASGAQSMVPKAKTAQTKATSSDTTPLQGDARVLHALNRLGFGPRSGDVARVNAMGLGRYIEEQLHPERIDDSAVEAQLKPLSLLQATPKHLRLVYEAETGLIGKLLQARGKMAMNGDMEMMDGGAIMQATGNQRMGARGEKRRAKLQSLQKRVPELDPAQLKPAEMQNYAAIQRADIRPGDGVRGVGELSNAKIVRAVNSKRQLNEVLVDFWSNHFNLDVRKGVVRTAKLVDDRDAIRPFAMKKFRELLGASAKSPAMLFYLDNVRSTAEMRPARRGMNAAGKIRKTRGGLNENYAREIMELHTLGVDGGYTQNDVQEVARCLTGWGINRENGTFGFNARAHDNGEKIVLGQKIPAGGGIKDGETVLDILANHPATAKHLSRKLCVRLVSDEPSQVLVDRIARKWTQTGGDLREVVGAIVYSPEFFAASSRRSKVKSPFEFAVSCVRALDGKITVPDPTQPYGRLRLVADGGASMQRGNGNNGNGLRTSMARAIGTMGQPLFAYQAPTGYDEDSRGWVSTGSLIARLNFTLELAANQIAHVGVEPAKLFEGVATDDHQAVLERLESRLLGAPLSPNTRATLLKQMPSGTPADTNKLTALVLGAPEFQRR